MWALVGHATFGLCDMVSITQDEEIMYLTEHSAKCQAHSKSSKMVFIIFLWGWGWRRERQLDR